MMTNPIHGAAKEAAGIRAMLTAVINRAIADLKGIGPYCRAIETIGAMKFILSGTCEAWCLKLGISYEDLKGKAIILYQRIPEKKREAWEEPPRKPTVNKRQDRPHSLRVQKTAVFSGSFTETLTAEEAMRITGYSRAQFYRLVQQNKIPSHKPVRGGLLFKQDELEEFIQLNKDSFRRKPEQIKDIEGGIRL